MRAVVVEPEGAGQGDCEGREGEGADEGEEVVEDWDCFSEYESLGVGGGNVSDVGEGQTGLEQEEEEEWEERKANLRS